MHRKQERQEKASKMHDQNCTENKMKIAIKENIQKKIASLQKKIISFKIILLLNDINIYGKQLIKSKSFLRYKKTN